MLFFCSLRRLGRSRSSLTCFLVVSECEKGTDPLFRHRIRGLILLKCRLEFRLVAPLEKRVRHVILSAHAYASRRASNGTRSKTTSDGRRLLPPSSIGTCMRATLWRGFSIEGCTIPSQLRTVLPSYGNLLKNKITQSRRDTRFHHHACPSRSREKNIRTSMAHVSDNGKRVLLSLSTWVSQASCGPLLLLLP